MGNDAFDDKAAKLAGAFGAHSVEGVKAHISARAGAPVGARAFIVGNPPTFGGGAKSGPLAAHELVHVIQQGGGKRLRLTGMSGAEAIALAATHGPVELDLLDATGKPQATLHGRIEPNEGATLHSHEVVFVSDGVARAQAHGHRRQAPVDFRMRVGKTSPF